MAPEEGGGLEEWCDDVSNYVRCYISDINIITLKAIQTESKKFDEWELIQGSSFNFKESYGYQGVFEREEALLEAIE